MISPDVQRIYEDLRGQIVELRKRTSLERKRTAVLFADLAESTQYKSERELVTSLLKIYRHNRELEEVVNRFRGSVIKSLGDGILATFDVSEPEDIAMPLGAAIRAQKHFMDENQHLSAEEAIGSRIGIACGIVMDFSALNPRGQEVKDPHGPIVDLAARLCSLARPGQILCEETVVGIATEGTQKFDFGPQALRSLKGFHQPVSVCTVIWSQKASPDVQHQPPEFYTQGFLTTDFVLRKLAQSQSFFRLVGLSHRHYCDNTDLYNMVTERCAENPDFAFELVFLNPFSEFKSYAERLTRRTVEDLRPVILRNLRSACRLFVDMEKWVRLVCSDYPMTVPLVQADDSLYFTVPYRSLARTGRRIGVVGGPYFRSHRDLELAKAIIENVERDRRIMLPIAAIVSGQSDLEELLRSQSGMTSAQ